MKKSIQVCLTPALLDTFDLTDKIVVVIDILRATTSMCVALHQGVEHIVPVETLEECESYADKGYIVAAERNGEVINGFAYGNSPYSFMDPSLEGKTLAMTTTNGTRALHAASDAKQIVAGAFANMSVLIDWLVSENENIVLLCAGWKNKINLEDTIFAGAMVEALREHFEPIDDASIIALCLQQAATVDKRFYLENSSHFNRLIRLNLQRDVKYSLRRDTHPVLPFYYNGVLIDGIAHRRAMSG